MILDRLLRSRNTEVGPSLTRIGRFPSSHNTVEMRDWKTIQERPIYFVWHEDGYSCSWCNVVRDTLFIVPYPTSRRPVMIFKMPRAATIIGRIIHVWPPLIIQGTPA